MDTPPPKDFSEARSLIRKDCATGLKVLEAEKAALVALHGTLSAHERCAYAIALIDGNLPGAALVEATRAAEDAAEDNLVKARALQTRAICLWRLRQIDDALEALRQASAVVPDDAWLELAGIAELEGLIYMALGDLGKAVACLMNGRDLLEETDNHDRRARNGINLVSAYLRLGDLKRALGAGIETRRALQDSESWHSRFILAFNLAAVQVKLEDYEAAAAEIARAREIRERSGITLDPTGLDALSAQVFLKIGDVESAARCARSVSEVADEGLAPLIRVNHLSSAAEVLRQLGHLEDADNCFERALSDRGAQESSSEMLEAQLGQLKVWLDQGRFDDVQSALDGLGELDSGALGTRALSQEVRGRAAAAMGDFEAALGFETQRSELLVEMGRQQRDHELRNLQVLHKLAESRAVRQALERSNEQLAEHVQQQTQALERAQRLEALGRLAGGVAHDFNNLLTVLGGSAQLLETELAQEPEAAALVTEMLLASERGARLTERLLAFGRRVDLSMSQCAVGSLLENTGFLLERLVGEEVTLVFRCELEEVDRDFRVAIDPVQLDSVLMNLCLNARDAMPGGGTLTLTTRASASGCEIDVSDTGTGIAEDVADSLFEPFSTTKPPGAGAGLGLASSLGLIDEMGGTLTLLETSGAGSTFRINLPLAELETRAVEAAPVLATADLEGLHAFVVEDDAAVRGLLAAFLRHLGLSVTEAVDGLDAFERLTESDCAEDHPDLVVSDVSMPRCTGPELYERLRAKGTNLPFLFVSGWHGRYLDELPVEDSNVDFLKKPIEIAELAARLRALMAVSREAYKSPISASSPSA